MNFGSTPKEDLNLIIVIFITIIIVFEEVFWKNVSKFIGKNTLFLNIFVYLTMTNKT